MENTYGMTSESFASYNRWHWILALLLAALLLLLPLFTGGRIGPYGSCAVPAAAVPAAAPAVVAVVPAAAPEPAPVAEPVAAALPVPSAKLYFNVKRFDLPADADTTLGAVVDYLKANAGAKAAITGFHDSQGGATSDANATLAKNRALAVAAALTRLGVAEAQVVMAKPAVSSGTGTLAEARRVEVVVTP